MVNLDLPTYSTAIGFTEFVIDKIYTHEGYTKGRKCIKLLLDSLPPAAALPPCNP